MAAPPDPALERFFALSVDLLCVAGLDGRFRRVSPSFTRTLGFPEAELLARPFLDFVHPEDVDGTQRAVARLAGGAPVLAFENRYRCADGSYRWLEWRSYPSDGLIYAVARDVTERRAAEGRTRAIVDGAFDAFVGMDAEGRVVDWNRQAERTFGWSREEALGRRVSELVIPPRRREEHERGLRRFLAGGEGPLLGRRTEMLAQLRDGREIPV
jgi:PAS domain S-box-containing protein